MILTIPFPQSFTSYSYYSAARNKDGHEKLNSGEGYMVSNPLHDKGEDIELGKQGSPEKPDLTN